MKKPLPIFFLLLSFVTFSCKDDENDLTQARLSKVSVTSSIYPDRNYSYTFSYNDEGLLKEYKESSSVGINSQSTHLYDDSKRLIAFDLLNQGNGSNIKQALIYDATGKLSSATIIYPNSSSSGVARPPLYLTFLYDGKGRVSRINSTTNPSEAGSAFILDYDESDNVIRERIYNTSLTGELYQPYSTQVISYDNKKNPFHRLGSPLVTYGYSFQSISSFISSFSPNNPVKVEIYNGWGKKSNILTFNYDYNEEGFPSEVKIGGSTQQFEYSMQ